MSDTLDLLDKPGLLAEASRVVRERRLGEVRDLQVLSQWASVHTSDPTEGPDAVTARRVGDVLVHLGGEGTPGVQDFCLGEIALARGTGVTATTHALADVLDLEHRLPKTWAVVCAGDAEVFIARRVARLSRHLSADCVGVVDASVARIISHESGGRVLSVAEAKIIEPTLPSTTSASRPSAPGATSGWDAPTSSASAPSSPASRPAMQSGSRRRSCGWRRS